MDSELAQDLNAYHSVDAEAELTSMLSEYVSMEIDLEILDMLMADVLLLRKSIGLLKLDMNILLTHFLKLVEIQTLYTQGEWFPNSW